MPDITYPYLSTLANNQILDADQLADDIYRRAYTPDSLGVWNGDIDSANLAGGFSVPREIVKRNAFTGLNRQPLVGATANLDFSAEQLFVGADLEASGDAYGYPIFGKSIPGLGKTWNNRRVPTAVLISWHFTVVCGTVSGTQELSPNGFSVGYRAWLNIDGIRVPETDFRGKEGTTSMLFTPTSTAAPYGDVNSIVPDTRDFTGALMVDSAFLTASSNFTAGEVTAAMAAGEHNANFDIVVQATTGQINGVINARVRCRHLSVIPFYW